MKSQNSQLPTHEEMIQNILSWYKRATREDVEDGVWWYASARNLCERWSRSFELPLGRVIDAVAVCSPRCNWDEQVEFMPKIFSAYIEGLRPLRSIGTRILGLNLDKTERILDGEQDVLRGNKVQSFAANIRGYYEAVTVDSWTGKVAGYKGRDPGRKYTEIAAAYRDAAHCLNLSPAILQAIVWVAARRVGLEAFR